MKAYDLNTIKSDLERAWNARIANPTLECVEGIRIFHGPSEGRGVFANLTIDRFKKWDWVTVKSEDPFGANYEQLLEDFLVTHDSAGSVIISRQKKGALETARLFFGKAPLEGWTIEEQGLRFKIRFHDVRHPGLFLDQQPLRQWLKRHLQNSTVLNTFAYTGSLSVACGVGGAAHVTSIDLSKAYLNWAQENWLLNELSPEKATWLARDVFEELPKLIKARQKFDCVILDPPSFSRGKKRDFSTSKDLALLHDFAAQLVSEGGHLISSINSENISLECMTKEILRGTRNAGVSFVMEMQIQQPETFPSHPDKPSQRYLKGWIMRRH